MQMGQPGLVGRHTDGGGRGGSPRGGARGSGPLQAESAVYVQSLYVYRHAQKREAGVAGTQNGSAGPEGHTMGHREAARGEGTGPLRP